VGGEGDEKLNPHAKILASLQSHGTACLVTVSKTEGSTPRETGAWMVITPQGFHGSIGGGTLEWHAMAEAQNMLGKPAAQKTIRKILGPDLGQCCGGVAELRLECFDETSLPSVQFKSENYVEDLRHLHIWGAGHVGRALVLALAPLPFRISWWDGRPNAFPSLVPQNVTCRRGVPQDMEPDSFVLVMSHSHALDFEIVDYALRNAEFYYVGLIGSETKKARFLKRLTCDSARLICPIGIPQLHSKHPAAIAAAVTVQLLQQDELLRTQKLTSEMHSKSFKAAI
jgi:xanthine dehydrogenase accessory factor